jgi:hypothetical protein
VYSTTAILPYLLSLSPSNKNSLDASFEAIAAYEQKLLNVLLVFLTAPEQFERGVRVVGDDKIGRDRVPTVSFVVIGQRAIKSKDVVKVFDSKGGVTSYFTYRLYPFILTAIHISVGRHPLWEILRIHTHRQLIPQA